MRNPAHTPKSEGCTGEVALCELLAVQPWAPVSESTHRIKLAKTMGRCNPAAEAQTDGFLGLDAQAHLTERGSHRSMRDPASKIR